jgi:glycosyltransferase involved in cell wall biosynthesis
MESFACGTPVIAADASSLSEAVTHGENGVLCATEKTECFVAAAEAMAKDPSAWQDMVIAARSTAEQRFSLDRMIEEYITLAAGLFEHEGRINAAYKDRHSRAP